MTSKMLQLFVCLLCVFLIGWSIVSMTTIIETFDTAVCNKVMANSEDVANLDCEFVWDAPVFSPQGLTIPSNADLKFQNTTTDDKTLLPIADIMNGPKTKKKVCHTETISRIVGTLLGPVNTMVSKSITENANIEQKSKVIDNDPDLLSVNTFLEVLYPKEYTVTDGHHCGGKTIELLEDGTEYGWAPPDKYFPNKQKKIAACKSKCTESGSCTAFVWRTDSKCFWKKNTSDKTTREHAGHDCYAKKL